MFKSQNVPKNDDECCEEGNSSGNADLQLACPQPVITMSEQLRWDPSQTECFLDTVTTTDGVDGPVMSTHADNIDCCEVGLSGDPMNQHDTDTPTMLMACNAVDQFTCSDAQCSSCLLSSQYLNRNMSPTGQFSQMDVPTSKVSCCNAGFESIFMDS